MSINIDKILESIPSRTDAQRRQMRENAGRKMLEGAAAEQNAARTLIDALDSYERSTRQEFYDRMARATTSERVIEAYRAQPPTATDAKVVGALLDNPGSTSGDLSKACGWEGQSWHLHFGLMCFNREAWLWPAERFEKRDAKFYTGILADFDESTKTFTMKGEVAEAFKAFGLGRRSR